MPFSVSAMYLSLRLADIVVISAVETQGAFVDDITFVYQNIPILYEQLHIFIRQLPKRGNNDRAPYIIVSMQLVQSSTIILRHTMGAPVHSTNSTVISVSI